MRNHRIDDPMKQSPRWLGVGRTETGHVRKTNQDVFAAINSCNFWIIADGMGGHPAGDVAAHVAVDVATQNAKSLLSTREQSSQQPPQHRTATMMAAMKSHHDHIR